MCIYTLAFWLNIVHLHIIMQCERATVVSILSEQSSSVIVKREYYIIAANHKHNASSAGVSSLSIAIHSYSTNSLMEHDKRCLPVVPVCAAVVEWHSSPVSDWSNGLAAGSLCQSASVPPPSNAR